MSDYLISFTLFEYSFKRCMGILSSKDLMAKFWTYPKFTVSVQNASTVHCSEHIEYGVLELVLLRVGGLGKKFKNLWSRA